MLGPIKTSNIKMDKNTTEFNIRKPTVEDMPRMIEMIEGLANYVNGHQCVAEESKCAELQKDAFGAKPWVHSFVAEIQTKDSKILVGFCLYVYSYSMFTGRQVYMESLYVEPEFRNKNIGLKLIASIAKEALEKNIKELMLASDLKNSRAMKFYKTLGAEDLTDTAGVYCFKFRLPEMKNLKKYADI